MPDLFAQVRIKATSAIGEDDAVNTFAFIGNEDRITMAGLALDMLTEFYAVDPAGGTHSINEYLATTHFNFGHEVKIYDLSDPEPRVPILETIMPGTAATPANTTNLPSEVSCCVSFAAVMESGSPAARRRGRIYIGPLNTAAGPGAANVYSVPASSFIENLVLAADNLMSTGNPDCAWGIYSRADDAVHQVVRGWVDNAWDTQRRRGRDATSRSTW